ncbi:MAG: DUF2200 domain-containing protein [Christensenellaceae bacterium]|jgi:hypothetical protein
MESPKLFKMSFAKLYPLYVAKAEKKGRTKEEVNQIIVWLTGYHEASLQQQIEKEVNLEAFFLEAPKMNEHISLITGVVCGVRVEEIEDETMRNIRYLDKLIDELAKGRSMEKILRK